MLYPLINLLLFVLTSGGVVALLCHSIIQVADHPKAEALSDIIRNVSTNSWEMVNSLTVN